MKTKVDLQVYHTRKKKGAEIIKREKERERKKRYARQTKKDEARKRAGREERGKCQRQQLRTRAPEVNINGHYAALISSYCQTLLVFWKEAPCLGSLATRAASGASGFSLGYVD